MYLPNFIFRKKKNMLLNDVMRLQEHLIMASEAHIVNGGTIGYYSPAVTPMGALYIMFLDADEDDISRDFCRDLRKDVSDALEFTLSLDTLKYFWNGFDYTHKPNFTKKQKENNLDYIYDIGCSLRQKYDPIKDDGEE